MTSAAQPALHLRPATAADLELIYKWRNRPEIVALGTSQRTVTLQEHCAWFERVLRSERHLLLIVQLEDVPIGQVRFDPLPQAEKSVSVSVYLLAPYTGKGLGVEALRQACQRAFADLGVRSIVAFVRDDNERSRAAFRKAGFSLDNSFPPPAGHLSLTLMRL